MGCTRFAEHFDRSADELAVDAVAEALDGAGLTQHDIDAFWLGTYISGISGMALARPLRLVGKPVTRVENMCATGSEALRAAVYAVACGAVDVAMAVGVEKLKDTGYAGLISPKIQDDGTRVNTSAPANFSLLVPAYQERYGVPPDLFRAAMTHVAWKNHANGARNPRPPFRRGGPPVRLHQLPRGRRLRTGGLRTGRPHRPSPRARPRRSTRLLHPDRDRPDGGPRLRRARSRLAGHPGRGLRPGRRAAREPRRGIEELRPSGRAQRAADDLRVLAPAARTGRGSPGRHRTPRAGPHPEPRGRPRRLRLLHIRGGHQPGLIRGRHHAGRRRWPAMLIGTTRMKCSEGIG